MIKFYLNVINSINFIKSRKRERERGRRKERQIDAKQWKEEKTEFINEFYLFESVEGAEVETYTSRISLSICKLNPKASVSCI